MCAVLFEVDACFPDIDMLSLPEAGNAADIACHGNGGGGDGDGDGSSDEFVDENSVTHDCGATAVHSLKWRNAHRLLLISYD